MSASVSGTGDNDPVIIVAGVTDVDATVYELRREGFLIESSSFINEEWSISLKMSHKLMIKLAFETEMTIVLAIESYSRHKELLARRAVLLILRTFKMNASEVWIAHNDRLVKEIAKSSGQERLHLINSYYGPKIALYFGWLDFYTQNLRIPATAGVLLYLHQYMIGSVDSTWVPMFCVGICLWGTCFLEFWKRRCSELSYAWEVFGVEDRYSRQNLRESSVVGRSFILKLLRLTISWSMVVAIACVLVMIMVFYKNVHVQAVEKFGSDSYLHYIPTIVYSFVPTVAAFFFDPMTENLTELEEHTSELDSENSLIYKKFVLHFVNCYCALLYTAFWAKDLAEVKALLVSLLTVGAILNNAMELGVPGVSKLFGSRTKADEVGRGLNGLNAANTSSAPYSGIKDKEAAKKAQAFLLGELSLSHYDLKEDYLEMVIQYGYVSMFAVVFPLAALLAYINNYFEAKVDSTKLSECRRCPIELRSNIGAWQTCLEFVSFFSVLTNCYLMVMVSTHLTVLVPDELDKYLNGEFANLVTMLLIEHILVVIKLLMMNLIDDVPSWVKEAVAMEKVERKATERDKRKYEFKRTASQYKMQGSESNGMSDAEPSSPTSSSLDSPVIKYGNTRSLAITRLMSECHTGFGFDPINMVFLIILPLALQWLGLPMWWYVPLAVLFFGYLQTQKDYSDRKVAVGLVSDPSLVKLIHQELPSWVNHSDIDRVEWFNMILTKLWPRLSSAVEDIVFASVQPLLDQNKPSYLSCLKLTKCHLGLISPKIVGIKTYDNEESTVRLDIELRWAGDPNIALKVGTLPLPMMVEVADLRFSATLRVELQDLKSQMPLFKALSITCMKKPFLDFSLKLASMDLMNIGASDYNISALVRGILHSVINDLMVYPAKLVIPMEKEGDEKTMDESQPPVGILTVTFERGVNLKQANIFGSDPYVLMKSSVFGEEHRTSIKYSTLNPEWNETFDFMIYDKGNQKINLTVYDYDMTTMEKMLGKAVIEISTLRYHKQTQRTLHLTSTDKGELVVSMVYIPLASSKDLAKQMEEDEREILFHVAESELTDELIKNESLQTTDVETLSNDSDSTDSSVGDGEEDRHTVGRLRSPTKTHLSERLYNVEAVGVLNVSQIAVTGLKMPRFKKFRPYVVMSVGDRSVRKTRTIKRTANPHYKESFSFIVKDPLAESLLVRIFDKSKITHHKLLGKVELPIQDVKSMSSGVLEQKYMLDCENQESYINLKLHWLASASC